MTEADKDYVLQTLATSMGVVITAINTDVGIEMVRRLERSMRLIRKLPVTPEPENTDEE